MKKLASLILILSILLSGCSLQPPAEKPVTETKVRPSDPPVYRITPLPALPTPTPATPDPWVEQKLAKMNAAEKIGQILMTGVSVSMMDDDTCRHIQETKPNGVFYEHHNVIDPEQLRKLSAALQECAFQTGNLPLFISTDHEGGYSRFQSGATEFPTSLAIGASGDPHLAYQAALASGKELAYAGVNFVLGPVADVLNSADNKLMAVRSYGSDALIVKEFVPQAAAGYAKAGLIAAMKHFPGHGGSDARYMQRLLPVDDSNLSTLKANYMPPFQAGIESGVNVIMLGHVAYPKVTGSELPGSLSPAIVQLLRQDLHFNGIIMTDAIMQREGITDDTHQVPDVALQAFQAGVDLLLLPEPDQMSATHKRFLLALEKEEINQQQVDAAVKRILTLKAAWNLKTFPVRQAPQPDWQANSQLAQQIGRQAVARIRDNAGLVPIPQDVKRVLVIAPQSDWSLYPMLEKAFEERDIQSKFVYYSAPWEGAIEQRDYTQSLPKEAASYDLTLFFTWQAHINGLAKDAWQGRMGKRLSRSGQKVIIIALRSPVDILDFPKVDTYLAMYGTTEGQFQALADILVGKQKAMGQNPIPQLMQ